MMQANIMMSEQTVEQFERMIYLPMLLTILDRDAHVIESTPVKFQAPYLSVIKRAMDNVHKDLTATNLYFKNNRMRLVTEDRDEVITAFLFIVGDNQYNRRYLNVRLRNRSQELLGIYLSGDSVGNGLKLSHVKK